MKAVKEPAADPEDLAGPASALRYVTPQMRVVARPGLWERLQQSPRVTVVSAPPGSGKTVLLRSWVAHAGLADQVAWVASGWEERDPQRFWLTVLRALRGTSAGSALVRELTASPDLDGWAIAERLLRDLAPLRKRLWLVIDDVHELESAEALRQLELLMMRAPEELRFVLATRHDVRLGLHRIRLQGELAEIRADDLRFTVAEARELLTAAGVELTDQSLALMVSRTEGWAAGLRLAALSLAAHPDPERFAAEFSGTERTVAEYLLAEVLDRQPEGVRRLLLRTSVLDRVNGHLADLLTGDSGGERILHDLEAANAFVMSLDAGRSWFRYHHLFAALLQMQLRHAEPEEVVVLLHQRAASWFEAQGFGVEAVRHAQAAQDWALATRLLTDHWLSLHLEGQEATAHTLLAAFPDEFRTTRAELAAIAAADELAQGSMAAAQGFLGLAEQLIASVPQAGRSQAEALLGTVQMMLSGRIGDQQARTRHARGLLSAPTGEGTPPAASEDSRVFALVEIGDSETWAGRLDDAESHLEQAIALARRNSRPYLEFMGLVYRAEIELNRCIPRTAELCQPAIELAERHGWTDDLFAGFNAMTLGAALAWQGRLDEAEGWVERAQLIFRAEANPAAAMGGQYVRGQLELGRGRFGDAVAAFRAAQRMAGPHPLARPLRAWLVHALVLAGDTTDADRFLASLSERDRDRAEMRIAAASLWLRRENPRAAAAALAPVVDASAKAGWQAWLAEAFLLEAITRDALGDPAAAGRALERALDLAEPNGALLWFLMHPAPDLLESHARHGTSHPAMIAEILSQLAKTGSGPSPTRPRPPIEPLTEGEIRVLRYLPTHLSAPEIAGELYVSTATVKTHLRSVYAKLGVHRRAEAVASARALGLLAPSGVQG